MVKVCCPKCGTIKEIVGTEKRVRCYSNACTNRFYVNIDTIVPEKKDTKDSIGTTDPHPQKTTIIHKPSKVSIPIDNVNWVLILKILDRGYSTIKNKPEVKAKKGGYYFDSLTWEAEINKIKEIAKVMKLMGNEEVK